MPTIASSPPPTAEENHSIAPAALCAATSAVFFGLGGVFLMGILFIVLPEIVAPPGAYSGPTGNGGPLRFLQVVLYVASGTSFAIGIGALVLALKKLP